MWRTCFIIFCKDMNMFMGDALHIILNIIKEVRIFKCISFVWMERNGMVGVCDFVAFHSDMTWPLFSFQMAVR